MNNEVQMMAPMSWAQLDQLTMAIIGDLYPELLTTPGPTPVLDFISFDLEEHLGIKLRVREGLPPDVEGVLTPAKDGQPPTLQLPLSTYEGLVALNRRDIFTGAHEGGHAVLHAKQLTEAYVSGKTPGLFRNRADIPKFRDPECQANAFAARFLMPAVSLKMAINKYGLNIGTLADIYCVSYSAMQYRLSNIGAL